MGVKLNRLIIGLNKVSRKGSSRKVYFRFLLIKGRDFYCNLFSSQQTWVLLIVQLGAILFQGILALATSYNELSTGPGVNDFEARFNAAFFGAVQTRHAGFAVYDMQVLKSSTLIAYLLFMFLAPAPLAAVQNSKAEMQALESQLEAMVEESFSAGTEIITEGDEGTTFYIIIDGNVCAMQDCKMLRSSHTPVHKDAMPLRPSTPSILGRAVDLKDVALAREEAPSRRGSGVSTASDCSGAGPE